MPNPKLICGVDEAGRGPLAGNVYAAAVILNSERPIVGLMDSKKLSATKREFLYELIINSATAYSIAYANVMEIDSLNILQATLLAMQRAVNALHIAPELVLIDGNQAPRLDMPAETIIKGDATIQVISAASILAKVKRDREMLELDRIYPGYGFAKHKGYGTAVHLAAIQKYGVLDGIHRRSFAPCR
jgi:ribonuclease HII